MATIEIDGKQIEAEVGQSIIEVADKHGFYIPRFCYHKNLSVAANCRMCLVEVEKSRKPLPACATPITDGMKVFTKSKLAIDAQKSVMEFLLINHPLDCPICDQGGECELQDLSMGFGSDVSRYNEGKRSVDDENLGSLIATDMTRCIHCTRCVRFGEEVAGIRELGATGRGENMRIGTYIKHTMTSEVSGNIIDLCPVGALTSKPYRFRARAWELTQKETIAPHDCLGSHLYVHTRRDQVMRVVPKENEAINETWISDRDRFSYTGLESRDRMTQPMINHNGHWQHCDWETALNAVVKGLKDIISKHGVNQIGALASPSSTTEEFYLLQKLIRGIGSTNIDHRLHQSDFSDDYHAEIAPTATISLQDLEKQQTVLLLGSNIQREQPLAGLRIRKVALNDGVVMAINPMPCQFSFDVKHNILIDVNRFVVVLAQIIKVIAASKPVDPLIEKLIEPVSVSPQAKTIAKQLLSSEKSCIVVGALLMNHPQAATLRSLARQIAQLTDSSFIPMTDGSNSAGAWYAGAVPHRREAGAQTKKIGFDAAKMIEGSLKSYILLNVEPELDCMNSQAAIKAMDFSEFVVVISPFASERMMEYANVILPIAAFTETSGSYVNVEGKWQSFQGCAAAFHEARPGWKVLRVLGNLFELDGFDQQSSSDVLAELRAKIDKIDFEKPAHFLPELLKENEPTLQRIGEWSIYSGDMLQRRSTALQQAPAQESLAIRVNSTVAKKFNLRQGRYAIATQGGNEVTLPIVIDEALPPNCVYLPSGRLETIGLGNAFGTIDLK